MCKPLKIAARGVAWCVILLLLSAGRMVAQTPFPVQPQVFRGDAHLQGLGQGALSVTFVSACVTALQDVACGPHPLRVTTPEAGFKIEVTVMKSCSPGAEAIWRWDFYLYKKVGSKFVEVARFLFKADKPEEKAGLQKIAAAGRVPAESARILRQKAYPIGKGLQGRQPTADEEATLKAVISEAAVKAGQP